MRLIRRASLVIALSVLLVSMGSDGLHLSPIELAALPYKYDHLTWEVTHVPDKWWHKMWSLLPWNSQSHEDRLEDLREFFRLGEEIRNLEGSLAQARAQSNPTEIADGDQDVAELQRRLDTLRNARSRMKPGVEETLESEVSAIIEEEGLASGIGLIFPPVDVAMSSPPRVLVVSPRDKIDRENTLLLKHDITVDDMERLEEKLFREQDLSALVTGIGGIATYPTIVRENASLRRAAILTAHEWLHTYWFFRPLGWNIFKSHDMNTLNETAATVAGEQMGLRAYRAVMGEGPTGAAPAIPSQGEAAPADQDSEAAEAFDFNAEMHKTRVTVDEMLKEGRVEEAEAYMERRRLEFVENGFFIRKLNQAYFAFHGTYATSPASVSPIGDQVERLRGASDSVGDFIRIMSGFGSYQEFLDYLSRAQDIGPGKKVGAALHPTP